MIPQAPTQLSLSFDPGLAEHHRSLKECLACRIYQQRGGLTAVAGKLDMSPSHLSEVLAGGGDRHRKFGLDELEKYVETYKDPTPILYLIAKYLPDAAAANTAARSPAPQEILLSRDSYTKLRNLSKSDDLDFRGIRLVCR